MNEVNEATVLDTRMGLDVTIASTPKVGVAEPISAVSPVAPTTTALRTTVLPRVQLVGAQTRVILEHQRRFEPLQRLGEGGLGEVTGVMDHDIGRKVAVKRLRPAVKSAATALRFAEEVRTVGQLEHPNIIPIHDVGVDEQGDYFFVMKYVDGETLETVIEKLAAGDAGYHARFGFEHRVQIFTALLDAVAFAHSKGIVHRDIKPANVMIGPYGEVVLMDWGIAKKTSSNIPDESSPDLQSIATSSRRGTLFETRVGEIVGTPAYASPEQARGAAIDERSDVYSLCMLFYELLTLSHPLANKQTLTEMLEAVQNEPTPHAAGVSNPHQPPTPAELAWFLVMGLAKDPAKRFQSINEMLGRLARRAEGDFPIQCPITFSKRIIFKAKRFVDHHPFGTMILLTTAVVGVITESVMLVMRSLH